MKIDIIDIANHHNGISGAPFKQVVFKAGEATKIAILFETHNHCAVFDVKAPEHGRLRIGADAFRGDCFEQPLRAALNDFRQFQAKEV